MRTLVFMLSALPLAFAANSPAQAKSDMQCTLEAREVTGDYDGLEYSQAKTACLLSGEYAARRGPAAVVIDESAEPDVAFTGRRRVASGTWVRVSPYRWVLRER